MFPPFGAGFAYARCVSRPLVSIVTPTLNQGRFIEQTIRSIMAQGYDHFEHIVVDGGSTDETLDILRRYEGTYPMRWVSEPDEGMYDAINKGMREAKGDILAYLNSDDLYFPWTLEVVVEAFAREPAADFVSGDCVRTDPAAGRSYLLFQPPLYVDWVMRTGYLAQPTVFWRRHVLEDVGEFDSSLRYVADCDYWMRALRAHRLVHVREFLAVDTIQPGAFRSAVGNDLRAETLAVRRRYVRMHGPVHRSRAVANRLWGALWRRLAWLELLAVSRSVRWPRRRWDRWLRATNPKISAGRAMLAQMPILGDRYAWRVLGSPGGGDD